MIRNIWLHGRFGQEITTDPIKLDVDTTEMAILGVCCLYPEFKELIRTYDNIGICRSTGDSEVVGIDHTTLGMTLGSSTDVHIVPAVEGGGVEIAAMFTWSSVSGFIVTALKHIAISWILGTIAQKLAPTPETQDRGPVDQRPSFIFNGPVNVSAPGYPVPLVYGRFRTGSVLISAGVTTESVVEKPDSQLIYATDTIQGPPGAELQIYLPVGKDEWMMGWFDTQNEEAPAQIWLGKAEGDMTYLMDPELTGNDFAAAAWNSGDTNKDLVCFAMANSSGYGLYYPGFTIYQRGIGDFWTPYSHYTSSAEDTTDVIYAEGFFIGTGATGKCYYLDLNVWEPDHSWGFAQLMSGLRTVAHNPVNNDIFVYSVTAGVVKCAKSNTSNLSSWSSKTLTGLPTTTIPTKVRYANGKFYMNDFSNSIYRVYESANGTTWSLVAGYETFEPAGNNGVFLSKAGEPLKLVKDSTTTDMVELIPELANTKYLFDLAPAYDPIADHAVMIRNRAIGSYPNSSSGYAKFGF